MQDAPEPDVSSLVVHAMAMPFTVHLRGIRDPSAADDAVRAFGESLREADALLSLWRPETPMSRVARGELSVDDAAPEIAEVLALAERWRQATDGAFDARLRRRAAARLPVTYPDGAPDPTGIVKAWAVARALPLLADAGSEAWLVDAAGDVSTWGRGPWRVGIADPAVRGAPAGTRPIDVITLRQGFAALATSGGAQSTDHLWDPVTGDVARHYLQVSVAGDDLVMCDAWATAIAAGGPVTLALAAARGIAALAVVAGRSTGGYDAVSTPGWPRLRY
ncbi:FAD:protein FMN transferase [Demequina capsici]|uniref:FAD:protein FMN transferase n=1 Tax=Demequina capsici TaxID=3075620 RepID=A0AA96FAY0_9MICO|nr:FAD:protein FMN transferase [Demequina sp. PMTSA13]WNM26318.1 FAD:protein FMN transferase [Demequina sp. PMTSA13]